MCHCFLGRLCKVCVCVCVWIQSQMYGGNKNETSLMTAQKQPGQRCVSVCVCVACDFKVTDGACHSFSARKPFTQEALLTGFVLMRRRTKRRSRYHSLIALTWLKPNSSPPLFFLSLVLRSLPDCLYHT